MVIGTLMTYSSYTFHTLKVRELKGNVQSFSIIGIVSLGFMSVYHEVAHAMASDPHFSSLVLWTPFVQCWEVWRTGAEEKICLSIVRLSCLWGCVSGGGARWLG